MLSPYHPMQLALGLIIWSFWFVALYAGLSIGCIVAPPLAEQGALNWLNLTLFAGTLIIAGLLFYLAWLCHVAARAGADRDIPVRRFIARVALGIHLVAAIGTLALAIPVLRLPPCY